MYEILAVMFGSVAFAALGALYVLPAGIVNYSTATKAAVTLLGRGSELQES